MRSISMVIEVNEAGFEQEVLRSQEPVLVKFGAPWCGWCEKLAPVLEEVAQDFAGKVKFVSLNTDENPGIKARYDVGGIPHLILFKNGVVADQIVGYTAKEIVASMLGPGETGNLPAELTQADFSEQVERNAKPALVIFGNPKRGAYRALIRNVGIAARNFADWGSFFKVSTDDAPDLCSRFHTGTSVLLFKDGSVMDRFDGEVSEETIASMLRFTDRIAPPDEVAGPEFEQRVLRSKTSVLVEFWAPWMGSYSRAARIVHERFPERVQFFRLNTETYPDLGKRYGEGNERPWLALFSDAGVVAKMHGYVRGPYLPEDEIVRTLAAWEAESRSEIAVPSLTPKDLQERVLQSHEPLLVYLGAPWMTSYRRVAHLIEESFGDRLKLSRVDTDRHPDILELHKAPVLPWIILVKDGEVATQFPGYFGLPLVDRIIAELGKYLAA